ncbi:sugar phosphate isomerase/epimerase [Lysinibacter sp. HNR]|uniref:sugar phosphate isomerase/epimerase family protein n=1 Tax=Lysinibacter sp. HNR TaxID=3031408 RepID=UPI002434A248|nr:sugar phosphate isomerase/epimerase [Lysinibacter sp. HNR]WGD37170.1 sugar phosphate isomerase/epimerase [Lysinibacter sp. HNR]
MSVRERIAAAPISWGVCEVPGWGYQLDPSIVFQQMRQLGITATEFGPEGFLPTDPHERATVLESAGLRAVGGFVPIVFHRKDHDPLPQIIAELEAHAAAGASTIVYAAVTGTEGYEQRSALGNGERDTLVANIERARVAAVSRGIMPVLHPHVGTVIESSVEIEEVLSRSSIGLCFDTGHLLIGGTDPRAFVSRYADRVVHAHLKDVRNDMAERVRRGEISYHDAVKRGMYCALGEGDAGIADIVRLLEEAGYSGWYVMEQDTVLTDKTQADTALGNVRKSLEFLRHHTE